MSPLEIDFERYQRRIAELEAALENTLPSEWTRLRLRAEKAEAEVEHWRDIASSLNEVVERQGAEVERLRAENRAMWKALGKPLSVEEATP